MEIFSKRGRFYKNGFGKALAKQIIVKKQVGITKTHYFTIYHIKEYK